MEQPQPQPPQPPLGFEASLERLETIANQMESGQLGLEDMVKAFEEGQKLVKACSSKLNEVEKRIEMLVQGEAVPFDGAAAGETPPAAPSAPAAAPAAGGEGDLPF
ncbi:MAG: exodeoxyribonuclease VII small subunit [Kiritimatiellae bacterium]|nr:exodeoxyribonuclease VII small subunit [Kiritimatiellia bacterium]